MKKDFYLKKNKEITRVLYKLEQQSQQLSWLRGSVAVLFVALIFASIQTKEQFYNLLAFGCLVLFAIFVFLHHRIEKKQSFQKAKQIVNAQILTRFSEEWKKLTDKGEEFLDELDYRSNDLDIYGANSLYQFLTGANTIKGRETLAKYLQGNDLNLNSIIRRQLASSELAKKADFGEDILAFSYQMSMNQFSRQTQFKSFIQSIAIKKSNSFRIMKILKWLFPLVIVFFLVCAFFKIEPEKSLAFASLGIVLNLGLSLIYYVKITEALHPLYGVARMLNLYEHIFYSLEQQSFECELLKELKSRLCRPTLASIGIKKLGIISEGVNMRFNAIAYLFFNGLLLWDFHVIESFDHWCNEYKDHLDDWLDVVGEFEALISLSTLEKVKEKTSVPRLSNKKEPFLLCKEIAHPLIYEKNAIRNSMQAEAQTWIITGSNMSGKTTFMRTIGTNLILAYAGANVVAERLETTCMAIYTSMRIKDDVSQGISTFYAEILRIKWMVEALKKEEKMISLIDEIFKGTNSTDRITGASEAVKKLSQKQCLTFVSTHDFELCNLVGSINPVVNYHFEEYYENGKIHFDYILKQGKCKTTNAQYLLKMAGIMEE